MLNSFMIFLGGGLGSVLRYLTKVLCDKVLPLSYPWGTFSVNIIGSFVLGFLFFHFLNKSEVDTSVKLFFTIGLTGGFTTFSTFSLDIVNLIKNDQLGLCILYILASVLLSVLAIYAGAYVSKCL